MSAGVLAAKAAFLATGWGAILLTARRLAGVPGVVPRRLFAAPATSDAPAPSFVVALAAFRRDFRWRCFWSGVADVLSLDYTLSRLRRTDNYDERLNLFETALPDESLRWIAANADVHEWNALFGGDALRNELCPPARSTTVERFVLLGKGQPAWSARINMIRGARKTLYVQYAYIYLDWYGWTFCEELAAAAKRGVAVSVMLDEFGAEAFNFARENPHHPCRPGKTSTWDGMMHVLVDAGVSLAYWRGKSSIDGNEFATKNHTKTLIADSRVAILGDRNIGVEYFDTWAGADILVVGEAALALERSFTDDMAPYLVRFTGGNATAAGPYQFTPATAAALTDDCSATAADGALEDYVGALPALFQATWYDGSSDFDTRSSAACIAAEILVHIPAPHGYDPILHRIISAVRSASSSVDIRSSYITLAKGLQAELVAACKRGVRVRILTNSSSTTDLLFVHTAMVHSLIAPVEAGAIVYVYEHPSPATLREKPTLIEPHAHRIQYTVNTLCLSV